MDSDSAPPPVPPVMPPPPGPPVPPAPAALPAPAAPRPPSGSRAWLWVLGVFAALCVLLLGGLLVAGLMGARHLGGLASSFGGHNRRTAHGAGALQEVTLEDNDSKNKIAVIDITGVISGEDGEEGVSLVDFIHDQLERAQTDEVNAIVLRVDSPGGEVLASDEIYRALHDFELTNDIPIVTSMGSLAASGGYYVSAASRWIVANELTITGSIGVIFHNYNYRGLMDKVGVLPQVVKSGKLKDMLSPDKRPEDELPEEKAILQDMINDSFRRFKAVVREGRGWAAEKNKKENVTDGRALADNWENFADGRILSGRSALDLGLVDELGNFEKAVDRAKTLAGIEDANLVSYALQPTFSRLFKLLGKTDARVLKIDVGGIHLGTSLTPGRLYFISPVHVH